MRGLSGEEAAALEDMIDGLAIAGTFVATSTHEEKSTVDANESIREALRLAGLHDYGTQRQGAESKVLIPAVDLTEGVVRNTTMSVYRPEAKEGDPRFWVYGMQLKTDHAIALVCAQGRVLIVDLSDGASVEAGVHALAVLVKPSSGLGESERLPWTSYVPERAFGGSEVAAIPGIEADGFWPEAPSAAGADEEIARFQEAIASGSAPLFLFLVGGPGNGKSLLSSRAVRGLVRCEAKSLMPAARSYEFEHENGNRVLLINDATIRFSVDQRHGLVQEVQRALDEGLFLLVNANRGVLLESLAAPHNGDSPGEDLLRWVAGLDAAGPPDGFTRTTAVSADVRATAVYLDACSLLEARPETDEAGQPGQYEVHRFGDRHQIGATSGGKLLSELVTACEQSPDAFAGVPDDWNPIAANLASLGSDSVRQGLVSQLRAAEIASGSRLTFRELWGIFARALMGGYDRGQSDVGRDLKHRLAKLEGEEAEFACLLELSSHRLHQSLFFAGSISTTGTLRQDPFHSPIVRVLKHVDPVLDAVPGFVDRGRGWSTPVNRALELRTSAAQPPLRNLAEDDPDIGEYVQDFDFTLESKVLAAIGSNGDVVSQRLQSWYGQYLMRLYAVAKGLSGFAEEVGIWTECWRQARHGQIPQSVYSALDALLLPRFAETRSLVLPALESRTTPLRGHQEHPIIVAKLAPNSILLTPHVHGDEVLIRLMRSVDQTVLAELPLDFALMREVAAVGAGEAGLTDAGFSASPRLERARSSLLSAANRPSWAIASGSDLIDLEGVN